MKIKGSMSIIPRMNYADFDELCKNQEASNNPWIPTKTVNEDLLEWTEKGLYPAENLIKTIKNISGIGQYAVFGSIVIIGEEVDNIYEVQIDDKGIMSIKRDLVITI